MTAPLCPQQATACDDNHVVPLPGRAHVPSQKTRLSNVRPCLVSSEGTHLASTVGSQQAKALPPAHCHAQIPHSLFGGVAILQEENCLTGCKMGLPLST